MKIFCPIKNSKIIFNQLNDYLFNKFKAIKNIIPNKSFNGFPARFYSFVLS